MLEILAMLRLAEPAGRRCGDGLSCAILGSSALHLYKSIIHFSLPFLECRKVTPPYYHQLIPAAYFLWYCYRSRSHMTEVYQNIKKESSRNSNSPIRAPDPQDRYNVFKIDFFPLSEGSR